MLCMAYKRWNETPSHQSYASESTTRIILLYATPFPNANTPYAKANIPRVNPQTNTADTNKVYIYTFIHRYKLFKNIYRYIDIWIYMDIYGYVYIYIYIYISLKWNATFSTHSAAMVSIAIMIIKHTPCLLRGGGRFSP